MTMPAMAPPERPLLSAWVPVRVMFAPVATGVWKGTVVVGLFVWVTSTSEEEVPRIGAVPVATMIPVAPAWVEVGVTYAEL